MGKQGEWYCRIDGTKIGPLAVYELRKLIEAGTLGGDDMVWTPSFGKKWRRCGDVQSIQPREKSGIEFDRPEADGPSEEELEDSEARRIEHASNIVYTLVEEGRGKKAIIIQLEGRFNLDQKEARELYRRIAGDRSLDYRKHGIATTGTGVLMFIIGAMITAFTIAVTNGAGFVVCYGLIFGGLYLIAVGTCRMIFGSITPVYYLTPIFLILGTIGFLAFARFANPDLYARIMEILTYRR